ncbi:MAG: hypothetical protein GFH27_549321n13 [Chloroflexi bacterium AL-W]|nr:hypothetical protein [Chloroflexi bacterium AL-W]
MSNLKAALDVGDDILVPKLTTDVKEIVKSTRGSKTRVRSATRVFALNESPEGDAQIAKWLQQKNVESVMLGLHDIVASHEKVDRFCHLLGERLLQGLPSTAWYWCVQTLLLMRHPDALVYVLDAAEQSSHGSPGTIGLLARGGKLKHESERVKDYIARWESTSHLDNATHWWILAKLGDETAYNALINLCLNGPMEADHAMRAAQALSHIHKWNAPWGIDGTEMVRVKLRQQSKESD